MDNDTIESKISAWNQKLAEFRDEVNEDLNLKYELLKHDLTETLKHDLIMRKKEIKKTKKDDQLSEKTFVNQESLLTEMFKDKNIVAIWALFSATLSIPVYQSWLFDYTLKGRIEFFDFKSVIVNFEGLSKAFVYCWLPMQLAALFLVYFGFKFWSVLRRNGPSKAIDTLFSLSYVLYLTTHIAFSLWIASQVAVCSAIFIISEQVRLTMKTYAFVRTNVPPILNYKKDDNDKKQHLPQLSKYVYFMFAPTLVYRDEYPRTEKIRVKFVVGQMIEIFLCFMVTYVIYERLALPKFTSVQLEKLDVAEVFNIFFFSCIPAGVYFLIAFYGLLHCWQNLWAEFLRFGDREFYSDWWNSKSLRSFMLKWNVLVNSWLNEYVYRDLHMITKGNRILNEVIVTLASALVYDYIISASFGLFYPVVTISMGLFGSLGMLVPFGNNSVGNVLVWIIVILFNAAHVLLISLEMKSRYSGDCTTQLWSSSFLFCRS